MALHPQRRKNKVKGARECLVLPSVAHCRTLNALSDGLVVSLSEGVSARRRTEPSAVARKRRVSSGRGERGHPRPRQREGPDGYEFCGAGRSRHWEGWSRRSRRNRAATRGFPSRTEAARQQDAMAAGRRWRESANELMKVDGIEKKHSEQLAATGPPGVGGGGG